MADPVPSRRSSTTSRRTARRSASRSSTANQNPNIFSDDHAVDSDSDSNTDGSAPEARADTNLARSTSTLQQTPSLRTPQRAASPPRVTEYLKKRLAGQDRPPPASHRSSLSTTRREISTNQANAAATPASQTAGRPLSSISALSIPSSEQSFLVPDGHSHAYAVYPSVSQLDRSSSTTSTVRTQTQSYTGPIRPTHPYALYPQIPGSSTESEDPFVDPADIANVGFPGLGQSYARRLGPDGEEADDLIGPDGHTEQLPPYSLFPQGIQSKQSGGVTDPQAPLPAGHSPTVHPAPSSTAVDDDDHPVVSQSTSLLADEEGVSANRPRSLEAGTSNPTVSTAWKQKTKKRSCWGRVPVWAWIVLVLFLCAVAATLGAVIGKSVGHHQAQVAEAKSIDANSSTATDDGALSASTTLWQTVTTTLVDASPLSSPPKDLPKLPTGTFTLPVRPGGAMSMAGNCLRKEEEKLAWTCNKQSFLKLTVGKMDQQNDSVFLVAEYPNDFPLLYGAQAPSMRGPASVQLVNDLGNMNAGPAYFFQQLIDKVIIVPGNDLATAAKIQNLPPPNLQARSIATENINDEMAHDGEETARIGVTWNDLKARDYPTANVITGDRLWYCFWNGTILEGFIYANHDATPDPTETAYAADIATNTMVTKAPTVAINVATATHSTLAAANSKRWHIHRLDHDNDHDSTTATGAVNDFPNVVYPKSIKIEERRSSGMLAPYCQQMIAQQDGIIVPARDSTGAMIRLNLTESSYVAQNNLQPNDSGATAVKRDLPGDDVSCSCSWEFT